MDKKVRNVDEYILNRPKETREKLEELRAVIQSAAPKAEEVISYSMPAYKYYGIVVYWGAHTNHYSMYGSPKALEFFAKELKEYKVAKATLHFSYDKKLPKALIRKIVKFRMKENELKKKK